MFEYHDGADVSLTMLISDVSLTMLISPFNLGYVDC